MAAIFFINSFIFWIAKYEALQKAGRKKENKKEILESW